MDFEKICRLCLEERGKMRFISEYQGDYMRNIFSSILQIEVSPDDPLPQKLCWQCISTLTKLNNTVQQFRANDQKLRNMVYGFTEIKTEIIEEDLEPSPLPIIKNEEVEINPDVAVIEEHYEELEEVCGETVVVDLEEAGEIKSPEFEEHEGLLDSQQHPDVSEQASKIIMSYWKMPTEEGGQPTIEIPKGKPGRPRVRPIIVRRKGVKGRRPIRFKDPNRPRKNDHKCYICMSDSLGSAEALFVHLNSHADQLPYTCDICVQETVLITQVTTLNIHKRMHLLPEKCPHCDKRFSGKHSVEMHIMMLHQELEAESASPLPCPTCGREFLSEKALKFHMHSHNQRIACEICGKTYISKTKLRVHIRRVHEKTGKVECHICHKLLNSLDAVQNHINIMHSNAKMKCKYCPKTYTSKVSLRVHEKRHETLPEGKEMCNDWKQYYTFVEGDVRNGVRMKKCNLCGAVVQGIGNHLTTTHFPKEYDCTICNAVFKHRKSLEVHLLEHSVGKFLKCPICGREFTDRRGLMAHLKTKKHRDHPLAQNTDWLDAKYPATVPKRMKEESATGTEEESAVESIEVVEHEWNEGV